MNALAKLGKKNTRIAAAVKRFAITGRKSTHIAAFAKKPTTAMN
jgi:hypothetical protein